MNHKIIYTLLSLVIFALPSFAEKAPVCITPSQILSTQKDEVQIGDWIEFQVVKDVYVNDKLYIKKDTPLVGVVDFIHPNGWVKDSAEVTFNKFYTVDGSNKKVEIDFPLKLNEKTLLDDNIKQIIIHDILTFIRGAEIHIEPNTRAFNIFLAR